MFLDHKTATRPQIDATSDGPKRGAYPYLAQAFGVSRVFGICNRLSFFWNLRRIFSRILRDSYSLIDQLPAGNHVYVKLQKVLDPRHGDDLKTVCFNATMWAVVGIP